jgi:Ca2+-binding EF-hand superfamily protein
MSEEIQAVFRSFDTDKSGTLNVTELAEAFAAMVRGTEKFSIYLLFATMPYLPPNPFSVYLRFTAFAGFLVLPSQR